MTSLGMYRQADKWHIVDTAAAPKPGDGLLKLDDMEVRIDPRAEWMQMYHEVWRIERDVLYDPGFHGVDLKATSKRFLPYLEHVASRRDLNYLFQEMLGEFSLGHDPRRVTRCSPGAFARNRDRGTLVIGNQQTHRLSSMSARYVGSLGRLLHGRKLGPQHGGQSNRVRSSR